MHATIVALAAAQLLFALPTASALQISAPRPTTQQYASQQYAVSVASHAADIDDSEHLAPLPDDSAHIAPLPDESAAPPLDDLPLRRRSAAGTAAATGGRLSFDSRSVGKRYAGPDAGCLRGAELVHATRTPLLSASECDDLVAEARSAIEAGATSSFTYTAASRIGEVHVAGLERGREWLRRKLGSTFFPLLAERYGLDASELCVYDSLVIGYDAARNATRQPVHRDAALISLNVALSGADEYEGGGTLLEPTGDVVSLAKGHAMCHPSGVRHAGHAITRGQRWVLVVFVISRREVQHSRRCAERGALAKAEAAAALRAGDEAAAEAALAEAEAAYEAGLEACATDHELHHARAHVHAMRGELLAARRSLLAATSLYPPCPKPANALGSMLLAADRPRAALRRFERALAAAVDESDDDSWEAAVNAALCITTLEGRRAGSSPTPPAMAVRWAERALAAAPGDARCAELLAAARAAAEALS